MIYNRQKQEEARARTLRVELEQEQLRLKAEKPALLAYNEFVATLTTLAADATRRGDLRRAIAAVVESISLDPHGEVVHGGKRWTYEIKLRGVAEPILCVNSPEGWSYRSLRMRWR